MDRAHALLLEPTVRNVAIACAALAKASRNVEEMQAGPAGYRVDSRFQEIALALRARLREVAALLDLAAAYHARLLESMLRAANVPGNPSAEPGGMGPGVQLDA